MKNFTKSVGFAISGILWVVRTERNFKVQLACAVSAVALGIVLDISAIQFAVVVLACGLVLSLELINTAVETYLDRFHPENDKTVGLVKDIFAGAVLLSAIASLVIGGLIFIDPLIDKL